MLFNTIIIIFLLIFFLFFISYFFQKKETKLVLKSFPSYFGGPLVSVIIPAFNEADYLPSCLKSLKNQTYKNMEIIVVDNDSEDNTVKIAEGFGVKVIKVKKKNLSFVRNEGARFAQGEILFFIDADSVLPPFFVEKMVKKLSEKTIFLQGGVFCYDSYFHNFLWFFLNRWVKPHFYTSGRNGVCIWKKVFWSVNGYDEKLNPVRGDREDLDLGMRILKKFGFLSIRYCPTIPIGSSARREKIFGYPIWKFPSAWQKGVRGVRGKKILR